MVTAIFLISAAIVFAVVLATYLPQSAYKNGMLFAVTLPKEAARHRDIAQIRTRFRKEMLNWSIALLALLIPMFFLKESFQVLYFLFWLTVSMIALVFPFRRAHRKTLALKRRQGWFVSGNDADRGKASGRKDDPDGDEFWGNGFTYHNPNDPRVFVEKRVGIGMTVNTGTTAGKWIIGSVIGISAAVLIFISFLVIRAELSPPVLTVTEDKKIEIDYFLYSYSFAAEDIREVSLLEELPRGRRINGEAMDEYARGHFNLDGIGRARMYLYKNHPPYIHIRLADGANILYNERDPQQTMDIFEKLSQFVPR